MCVLRVCDVCDMSGVCARACPRVCSQSVVGANQMWILEGAFGREKRAGGSGGGRAGAPRPPPGKRHDGIASARRGSKGALDARAVTEEGQRAGSIRSERGKEGAGDTRKGKRKAPPRAPARKSRERQEEGQKNSCLTGGGGKDGRRAAHGQRRQLGLAQVLVVGEQVVDDGVDVGAADGAQELKVGRGLFRRLRCFLGGRGVVS